MLFLCIATNTIFFPSLFNKKKRKKSLIHSYALLVFSFAFFFAIILFSLVFIFFYFYFHQFDQVSFFVFLALRAVDVNTSVTSFKLSCALFSCSSNFTTIGLTN